MDSRVAPQAESDLDEIWYFLATQSRNIDVADRVVDSLTAQQRHFARSLSKKDRQRLDRLIHAIGTNGVAERWIREDLLGLADSFIARRRASTSAKT